MDIEEILKQLDPNFQKKLAELATKGIREDKEYIFKQFFWKDRPKEIDWLKIKTTLNQYSSNRLDITFRLGHTNFKFICSYREVKEPEPIEVKVSKNGDNNDKES